MDLGERKSPSSDSTSENLIRYVEGLNDARTPPAERRVSARRGWAGEKSDCFSILLPIEGLASITEQIIVARKGFVSRVSRVYLDDTEFFLVPRRAMQNRPLGSDDFTVPDKRQLIFVPSCFAPCAITRNRKHSILQTPNRHGVRAIG
jgi:hypothetical protein